MGSVLSPALTTIGVDDVLSASFATIGVDETSFTSSSGVLMTVWKQTLFRRRKVERERAREVKGTVILLAFLQTLALL
jgi:hypothetical protein